ncbi:envelope protein [Candidatus Nitrosotalea bavarica]|uniref:envelope protein n=1 Tax=Candidatus Nitrosotalea bavarica TaxID=1903277 RepID=UPI000C713C65|nr:envelope protein [Candidatus Nitrosotalea bavarica]
MKLIIILLIVFTVLGNFLSYAYALQMSTDREVYSEGQPLLVYGTGLPNEPIIIRLFAPDGTIAQFDQITADAGGNFEHILIRWPNATTTYTYGTYTVEAIASKEQGQSQKIDVKFAPSTTLEKIPIQRIVNVVVFTPQTAAINQTFRVFVQVTSDGLLVAGDPLKILGTSHVHLPSGDVESLANSLKTLHQGLYYADYTPTQEGTYVFHIVYFDQGTISHGSSATQVLKQNIEGISNQILKLNSVLDSTSQELDKLKTEIQGFGNVLDTSQQSISEANQNINKSVSSMSDSVKNIEEASGQFNSLFLPVVALIAIIIALQITILARRR